MQILKNQVSKMLITVNKNQVSKMLITVNKNQVSKMLITVNKNPTDVTVCRYLFTAKLLYMFRVSQHPSSGELKTVPADSGTGRTTCNATPLQRSPDQTTLEGSSGTSSMTCTGGRGYSF